MGSEASVVLVHETRGCVLILVLANVGVGRSQREHLHVVGGGVAPTLIVTVIEKREGKISTH